MLHRILIKVLQSAPNTSRIQGLVRQTNSSDLNKFPLFQSSELKICEGISSDLGIMRHTRHNGPDVTN